MTNIAEKKSLPWSTVAALQQHLNENGLTAQQSTEACRTIEASKNVQDILRLGAPDPRDVPFAIEMGAHAIADKTLRDAVLKALSGEDVNLLLMASANTSDGGGIGALTLLAALRSVR